MINIIGNIKKNTFITKGKRKKDRNRFSFKADNELAQHIRKKSYDKSRFIKSALRFYILLIDNPKKIMIELKRNHPTLWKYVNRKKFN